MRPLHGSDHPRFGGCIKRALAVCLAAILSFPTLPLIPEHKAFAEVPPVIRGTVYHLQDAHESLSAQKQIARKIFQLQRKYGIRTVAFEGAPVGPVVGSDFKEGATRKSLKRASDEFLAKGYFGAAEYAYLTAKEEPELWGVEDPQSYLNNLKHFQALLRGRGRTLKIWNNLNRLTEYPKVRWSRVEDKRKIERLILELESPKLDLLLWVKAIDPLVRSERFPVKSFPGYEALRDLIELAQDKVSPDEVKERIAKLRGRSVLSELSEIGWRLRERMADSPEEKDWVRFRLRLELTKKFCLGEMTPRELAQLGSIQDSVPALSEFFSEEDRTRIEAMLVLLGPVMRETEQFYFWAGVRSQTMGENVMKYLEQSGDEEVILITGGFHTQELKHYLRLRGILYRSWKPRIPEDDEKVPYRERMKEETPYDLVSGSKIRKATPFDPRFGNGFLQEFRKITGVTEEMLLERRRKRWTSARSLGEAVNAVQPRASFGEVFSGLLTGKNFLDSQGKPIFREEVPGRVYVMNPSFRGSAEDALRFMFKNEFLAEEVIERYNRSYGGIKFSGKETNVLHVDLLLHVLAGVARDLEQLPKSKAMRNFNRRKQGLTGVITQYQISKYPYVIKWFGGPYLKEDFVTLFGLDGLGKVIFSPVLEFWRTYWDNPFILRIFVSLFGPKVFKNPFIEETIRVGPHLMVGNFSIDTHSEPRPPPPQRIEEVKKDIESRRSARFISQNLLGNQTTLRFLRMWTDEDIPIDKALEKIEALEALVTALVSEVDGASHILNQYQERHRLIWQLRDLVEERDESKKPLFVHREKRRENWAGLKQDIQWAIRVFRESRDLSRDSPDENRLKSVFAKDIFRIDGRAYAMADFLSKRVPENRELVESLSTWEEIPDVLDQLMEWADRFANQNLSNLDLSHILDAYTKQVPRRLNGTGKNEAETFLLSRAAGIFRSGKGGEAENEIDNWDQVLAALVLHEVIYQTSAFTLTERLGYDPAVSYSFQKEEDRVWHEVDISDKHFRPGRYDDALNWAEDLNDPGQRDRGLNLLWQFLFSVPPGSGSKRDQERVDWTMTHLTVPVLDNSGQIESIQLNGARLEGDWEDPAYVAVAPGRNVPVHPFLTLRNPTDQWVVYRIDHLRGEEPDIGRDKPALETAPVVGKMIALWMLFHDETSRTTVAVYESDGLREIVRYLGGRVPNSPELDEDRDFIMPIENPPLRTPFLEGMEWEIDQDKTANLTAQTAFGLLKDSGNLASSARQPKPLNRHPRIDLLRREMMEGVNPQLESEFTYQGIPEGVLSQGEPPKDPALVVRFTSGAFAGFSVILEPDIFTVNRKQAGRAGGDRTFASPGNLLRVKDSGRSLLERTLQAFLLLRSQKQLSPLDEIVFGRWEPWLLGVIERMPFNGQTNGGGKSLGENFTSSPTLLKRGKAEWEIARLVLEGSRRIFSEGGAVDLETLVREAAGPLEVVVFWKAFKSGVLGPHLAELFGKLNSLRVTIVDDELTGKEIYRRLLRMDPDGLLRPYLMREQLVVPRKARLPEILNQAGKRLAKSYGPNYEQSLAVVFSDESLGQPLGEAEMLARAPRARRFVVRGTMSFGVIPGAIFTLLGADPRDYFKRAFLNSDIWTMTPTSLALVNTLLAKHKHQIQLQLSA